MTNSAPSESLTIVIPAWNEEEGIASVIERIRKVDVGLPTKILVVDDGSRDGTAAAAELAGATVLRHPINRGYGAALKSGIEAADSELIAFLDADGTYPPEALPKLVERIRQNDVQVVVGSRFAGQRSGMPWIRRIGNRAFTAFINLFTGARITDCASGMRLFRKEVVALLSTLSDDLDFTPEMTTECLERGVSYLEVPIEYAERIGESKLSVFRHGFIFLGTIIKVIRDHRPVVIFGTSGALFLATGVALCFFVVVDFLLRSVPHLYTLTFGVLAISLGIQLVMFGFLADMFVRFRRRGP